MNHVYDNNSVQVGFADGVLTEFVDAGQHRRDSIELRKLCEARDEARKTAEYWKAEHLAGNAEIATQAKHINFLNAEIARLVIRNSALKEAVLYLCNREEPITEEQADQLRAAITQQEPK